MILPILFGLLACTPQSTHDAATPPQALGPEQPPLLALELPASSRAEGAPAPERVACSGPWEQVWSQGELKEYRTQLPFDQVFLGESQKRAPVGMRVLEKRGTAIPYQRRRSALGPEEWSWRLVGRHLFLRGPGPAPAPGAIAVRYPRAAKWENGLNLSSSDGEPEALAFRRTGLVHDDPQGIFLPAPGRLRWRVEIPPGGVLGFDAKLLRPAVDEGLRSDGVELQIRVKDGRRAHLLQSIPVVPGEDWAQHRVSLEHYAGRSVELELRSEPGDEALLDYLFLAEPAVFTPDPSPRRLVLVFIDTLRRDHLGLYGYRRHETSPTLDRWAQQAVVFDQARATAPWTLPSVRAILGGSVSEPWAESTALPERLQAGGFVTGFLCNNPYLRPHFGMERGWTRYRFELMASAERQVDRALAWLERHPDRDTALLVQFMDPHMPYEEPEPYRSLWTEGKPEAYPGTAARDPLMRLDPQDPVTAEVQDWVQARYDQNIRYVDDQLARLLEAVGEDAVVVVFSDHGEELWDHGGVEHGHSLHEELLAIPLLIRAPGLEPQRVQAPVSLLDLAPTVLELMGIVPEHRAGRESLVPLMRGEGAAADALAQRPMAFGQTLYGDEAWGLLRGTDKWWLEGHRQHRYDLEQDPQERHDLALLPEHDTEAWTRALAEVLEAPVLPVWRVQGQGQRKSTSQRGGRVVLQHPDGFSRTWSIPGIKEEVAEPALVEGAATVQASRAHPVPREWYALRQPADLEAAGLTLTVERGQERWSAALGPDADLDAPILLEAGEGELAYHVSRAWAPWFGGQASETADEETAEQLRLLGYVE
jgi:arylsulfatase A-like enzyme